MRDGTTIPRWRPPAPHGEPQPLRVILPCAAPAPGPPISLIPSAYGPHRVLWPCICALASPRACAPPAGALLRVPAGPAVSGQPRWGSEPTWPSGLIQLSGALRHSRPRASAGGPRFPMLVEVRRHARRRSVHGGAERCGRATFTDAENGGWPKPADNSATHVSHTNGRKSIDMMKVCRRACSALPSTAHWRMHVLLEIFAKGQGALLRSPSQSYRHGAPV